MRRTLLALMAAAALAACSNDPYQKPQVQSVAAMIRDAVSPADAPAPVPAPDTVLAATQAPVILAVNERTKAAVYLLRIAENRGYQVFATSDRRTVTLRDGLITATRGLGNDLMSADIEQTRARLRDRTPGPATRVHRLLDGEGLTRTIQLSCTLAAGPEVRVSAGAIDRRARTMTETCTADGRTIENRYLVAADGTVLQSRQWINAAVGYLQISHLRL